MARIRLTLEYDGSGFEGWQLQPGSRTIQGELEGALQRILGHATRVHTAGRTDSGVHARGQVVRFDTPTEMPTERIRNALNGLLAPEVACLEAAIAPDNFDPRRWRHTKQYRYRWLDRRAPSPLRHKLVWHTHHPLDVEKMMAAAAYCLGTHDFSSFRASKCSAKHPVRTIERCDVLRVEDEVHLVVEGTGFLRHMIRIMAGSITEVGRGRRPPEWIPEVLALRDRQRAGKTAPAQGLTMEWIRYHERLPELPLVDDPTDE